MSVITVPMPADLPTDWINSQIIAPNGADVGLSIQHGYNYLMQQVNASQTAISQIDDILSGYVANIQTGSYIGTGVYGIDNPNSITFAFTPKLVLCGMTQVSLGNWIDSGTLHCGIMLASMLTTSYQQNFAFGVWTPANSPFTKSYGKISGDGKTITWYNDSGTTGQNNENKKTYHWLAIG